MKNTLRRLKGFWQGAWYGVWTGSNPRPTFGTGARECARRRRQILAGRIPRDQIQGGDLLAATQVAYSIEHPLDIRRSA